MGSEAGAQAVPEPACGEGISESDPVISGICIPVMSCCSLGCGEEDASCGVAACCSCGDGGGFVAASCEKANAATHKNAAQSKTLLSFNGLIGCMSNRKATAAR